MVIETKKTISKNELEEKDEGYSSEEDFDTPIFKKTNPQLNSEQSLEELTSQILAEREKYNNLLIEKDQRIKQLITTLNVLTFQLKTALGVSPTEDLPINWMSKITKKSEISLIKTELNGWKEKFPNTTPQKLSWEISQLKEEKTQLKKELKKVQPETSTIYFCDVCQTTKNSKVDGEVYQIKISIHPNTISNVCPACRPNVVMISDDNWNDF